MSAVLNIMTARRFKEADSSAQEPYEYTDVSSFDNVTVQIRVLFGPGSTALTLNFNTGMFRRADCMKTVRTETIGATDDTIVQFVLGRDPSVAHETLGKWLGLSWVATNNAVVEVKAVGK